MREMHRLAHRVPRELQRERKSDKSYSSRDYQVELSWDLEVRILLAVALFLTPFEEPH